MQAVEGSVEEDGGRGPRFGGHGPHHWQGKGLAAGGRYSVRRHLSTLVLSTLVVLKISNGGVRAYMLYAAGGREDGAFSRAIAVGAPPPCCNILGGLAVDAALPFGGFSVPLVLLAHLVFGSGGVDGGRRLVPALLQGCKRG